MQPYETDSLTSLVVQYRGDEETMFTMECCWQDATIPLGFYITGFRTYIDEELEKITRLDFLLGGEESTYLDTTELVFGSTIESNWTYEWPTTADLKDYNVRTVKDEFTLTGISVKDSASPYRLAGLKLNYKEFETSWF